MRAILLLVLVSCTPDKNGSDTTDTRGEDTHRTEDSSELDDTFESGTDSGATDTFDTVDTNPGDTADDTGGPSCHDADTLCGNEIEVTLREEWMYPYMNDQNDGVTLPSGATLDVSSDSAIMEAIYKGVWPPYFGPVNWPDSYDVGDELCAMYGENPERQWCDWDILDWPVEIQDELLELIVHHTAGEVATTCDQAMIDMANGHTYYNFWGDGPAYNFVACIDDDGWHVYEGRHSGSDDPLRDPFTGVWAEGGAAYPNTGRVSTAIVANLSHRSPTDDERELYLRLNVRVLREAGLNPEDAELHSAVSATECPGLLYVPSPADDIAERWAYCEACEVF